MDNNDLRKATLDDFNTQKTEQSGVLDQAKQIQSGAERTYKRKKRQGAISGGLIGGSVLGGVAGSILGSGNAKSQRNKARANTKVEQDKFNEIQRKIKAEEAVSEADRAFVTDFQVAGQNLDSLGLEFDLGRIRDDESVNEARGAYRDATDMSLVRDRAVEGLQGAEQSANRQLMARLGQSGVKGGLAGGALTDMASMNLRNRASMERDLNIQSVQANQQRAQFETQLAQFDIGQAAAESSMRNTTKMGMVGNSMLARSGAKAEDIAKSMGNMSGGNKL